MRSHISHNNNKRGNWRIFYIVLVNMLPSLLLRPSLLTAGNRVTAFVYSSYSNLHRRCYLGSFSSFAAYSTSTPFSNSNETGHPSTRTTYEHVQQHMLNIEQQQKLYTSQMKDFKGVSHSTSEFVTHFIAQSNHTITVEEAILSIVPNPVPKTRIHDWAKNPNSKEDKKEISMELWTEKLLQYEQNHAILHELDTKFRHNPAFIGNNPNNSNNTQKDQLSPAELLALGSVWFLPWDAVKDPSLGAKPTRISLSDLRKPLLQGDYIRVHHTPRRFPMTNSYDWGKYIQNQNLGDNINEYKSDDGHLPGVIIAEDRDQGFVVVNKPPNVPVHPTVDNVLENVSGAVGRSLLSNCASSELKSYVDSSIYVTAAQRLDQNTSGIFLLATKKSFASYFAKMLRKKTEKELSKDVTDKKDSATSIDDNQRVRKRYRCLVCINSSGLTFNQTDSALSAEHYEENYLRLSARSNTTIRHYLELSKGAPKKFSSSPDKDSTWLECWMKICNVGSPYPVTDGPEAEKLCEKLWGNLSCKPKECVAVVEVEVELLTGRTHQIRGQFASMGHPLCGDIMYGGARDADDQHSPKANGYVNSELLALQCCELSFLDQLSQRNRFRLERAWWSPALIEWNTGVDPKFKI